MQARAEASGGRGAGCVLELTPSSYHLSVRSTTVTRATHIKDVLILPCIFINALITFLRFHIRMRLVRPQRAAGPARYTWVKVSCLPSSLGNCRGYRFLVVTSKMSRCQVQPRKRCHETGEIESKLVGLDLGGNGPNFVPASDALLSRGLYTSA